MILHQRESLQLTVAFSETTVHRNCSANNYRNAYNVLHNTLLYEDVDFLLHGHHDFFFASQHPPAGLNWL